jgi:hypothetical protein
LPIKRLWPRVSLMIIKGGSRLSSLVEISRVIFKSFIKPVLLCLLREPLNSKMQKPMNGRCLRQPTAI